MSNVPSPQGPHMKDFRNPFSSSPTSPMTTDSQNNFHSYSITNNSPLTRINSQTVNNENNVNQNVKREDSQNNELVSKISILFSDYAQFYSDSCSCQSRDTQLCNR